MGLNEGSQGSKTYLSIVNGKITKRLKSKDDEGAVARVIKASATNGMTEDKTVYERYYQSFDGVIEGITLEETPFGSTNICVHLDDVGDKFVLQIGLNTRYGSNFVYRGLNGMKPGVKTMFKPYSFEDDKGKKSIGIVIEQGGAKIASKFNKENDGGAPKFPQEKDAKKQNRAVDAWKLEMKHFIEDRANELVAMFPMDAATPPESTNSEVSGDEDDSGLPF